MILPSIGTNQKEDYIMNTQKLTASELGQVSDGITSAAITVSILSIVPDLTEFERENGNFTAAQQ